MNKTQIVSCGCKSKFQDETYGKGQRVTTPNNKEQAKKNFVVRCTVCAREHNLGQVMHNAPHEGPGAASSRTVPLDAVVGHGR